MVVAVVGFNSCKEDPIDEPDVDTSTDVQVTANITSNTTWETGKVYILTDRIAVESGATLTIQKGVIIKGQAGTGANATALIIARGANHFYIRS